MEPKRSLPHSQIPCHLSLSRASSVQSIPPHPTSWRSILNTEWPESRYTVYMKYSNPCIPTFGPLCIILPSTTGSPRRSLSPRFRHQNPVHDSPRHHLGTAKLFEPLLFVTSSSSMTLQPPEWAVASVTIHLQASRSLALSFHSLIPIFVRSVDTSSSHLIFGLPLRLVAYSFPYIFFRNCGVLHSFYMTKPSYSLAFYIPDNVLPLNYSF